MRWTQAALLTRARTCGRRSRVVLTPRRWCQVGEGNSACDGVNKPITGESTKETVKPLRGECRVISGVTVVTNARALYPTRAAAGALGARHSLRPLMSEGGMFIAKLGRIALRDRDVMSAECGCLKFESVRLSRASARMMRRPCEIRDKREIAPPWRMSPCFRGTTLRVPLGRCDSITTPPAPPSRYPPSRCGRRIPSA